MKTILLSALFLFGGIVNAQMAYLSPPELFKNKLSLEVKKTGPYIGLQKGNYTVLEIGVERQWKEIKLMTAETHAAHVGFNYNFKRNVLGYDIGYWLKPNRLGLTYGGSVVFRTNFERSALGLAPMIGFKFYMLHLQTGFHLLTVKPHLMETNGFFVSLRLNLISDRDFDWKKKKKTT